MARRRHSPAQKNIPQSTCVDNAVVAPVDSVDPSDYAFDVDDDDLDEYQQYMDELNLIDFSGESSDSDDSDDDESSIPAKQGSQGKSNLVEPHGKQKRNNSRYLAHRLLYEDNGKVAKQTMAEFNDIVSHILLSDEKKFQAGRPVTLDDVERMIKACGITDADAKLNSGRISRMIREVLASADGLDRAELWKRYNDMDDTELLSSLPLLKAIQVCGVMLRPESDVRPSEILVIKGMIKDHLDSLVVTNGEIMSWFGVQRSTMCKDTTHTPVNLCTGSTDKSIRNPYATKGNDCPLGSALKSPYMTARHKPVKNGRPMARHVQIMRSLPCFDAENLKQQTTKVPQEDRVERNGKSQFIPPYAGVVYRCFAGGNSDWLPNPTLISGAKGIGTQVRDELNRLTGSVRVARQVPPLYPSLMALRLLPSSVGGCSTRVLVESAAGDGDDEGERPPSLRDKLQLHNFIRDIAWTNLISLNKLMGTPPDNMIYSSIFDELGEEAQFAFILQLCSSLPLFTST